MGRKSSILQEWLEIAEAELASANHLQTLHPKPLEVICYLSQQAGEKYLKAFLCYCGQEIPKTHNLIKLYQLCKGFDGEFSALSKACTNLTPYATSTRYPDREEIFECDMELALESSCAIGDFVKQRLPIQGDTIRVQQ